MLIDTLVALGLALREQAEVRDLRRGEQLRGAVRARGHARAAADAGGGVHRRVGRFLRHEDQVGVGRAPGGRGDEAAGLDDPVERAAVDDEVADDRERACPPRLHGDLVAVVELAHVQLARGGAGLGTVRPAVDHHRARTADALAAVVVERDRLAAVGEQLLVEDVEQLEERHVGADVRDVEVLELAGRGRALLAPHPELQIHDWSRDLAYA